MSDRIHLYQYSIPFRNPLRTATGSIVHRDGLIIGDGNHIWSEIAPLPGFSTESIDDVLCFLRHYQNKIQYYFQKQNLYQFMAEPAISKDLIKIPSLRFGLSMIAEQQKALDANLPLYAYWIHTKLSEFKHIRQFSPSTYEQDVRCNALLGAENFSDTLKGVIKAREAGFNTVKLKLPPSPRKARELVATICKNFPDMRFRFDANACYSKADAVKLFDGLNKPQSTLNTSAFDLTSKTISSSGNREKPDSYTKPFENLDYIEEPIKAENAADLLALKKSGVPMALDETARTSESVAEFLSNHTISAVVLKPTLIGSFNEILSMIEQIIIYNSQNTGSEQQTQSTAETIKPKHVSMTVSTSLETSVGRLLLAHLAAFINNISPNDHGLATGDLLKADILLKSPNDNAPARRFRYSLDNLPLTCKTVSQPVITLPASPGAGRKPDTSNSREHTADKPKEHETRNQSYGHTNTAYCKAISWDKP